MDNSTNNSFTLTPMNQDIDLAPGQSYTGTITVVNPADATTDFVYKVAVTPFNMVGQDYTVDLATEYNRSMITKWITIAEPTGTLKPNESKDIEFADDRDSLIGRATPIDPEPMLFLNVKKS